MGKQVGEWGPGGILTIRWYALLWPKFIFWGIESEEWAVFSVTVTVLPFLIADTALPQALLCPWSGPRACLHPSRFSQLQESYL
jgi:hypothetical protein